jgi:hypothetical protein
LSFGHHIHLARMVLNQVRWEKAGCCVPSFITDLDRDW